jgi:hypothetical protein
MTCIGTNNNGSTIPGCVAALIQTGGTVNTGNCHVTGSTGCSPDRWISGAAIPPNDPRIVTAFIVYPQDLNQNGSHPVVIRTFASFYVTGWQYNGQTVNCSDNETTPAGLQNNDIAIWGHWFSNFDPSASGGETPCDPQQFGNCAPVLTR